MKHFSLKKNYYPINYLRNVALENVLTGFCFLSDIDFLPGIDAYASVKKSVHSFYHIDLTTNEIIPTLIGTRFVPNILF